MLQTSHLRPLLRKFTTIVCSPNVLKSSPAFSRQLPTHRVPAKLKTNPVKTSRDKLPVEGPARTSGSKAALNLEKLITDIGNEKIVFPEQLEKTVQIICANSEEKLSNWRLHVLLTASITSAKTVDADRMKSIINRIWSLRNEETVDISHYNAYLQAKIAHGLPVDMENTLEQLSRCRLKPNRVTYERFIESFCASGNITAALQIADRSISDPQHRTRSVYHSLINGHLKATGNLDDVERTIITMKNFGIIPNADTATIIASGLAERGRNELVLEAIKSEALTYKQLLAIVKSTSDPSGLIDELLQRVAQTNWSMDYVKMFCVELLHHRRLNEALLVFEKLIRPARGGQRFFSCQMIKSNYSVDDVMRFCKRFGTRDQVKRSVLAAVKLALDSEDSLTGLKYVTHLHDDTNHIPVREHYFYPLICKARSELDVYAVLHRMTSFKLPISEDTLSFVFANVDYAKPFDTLTKLQHFDTDQRSVKRALQKFYVSEKHFNYCVEYFDVFHDATEWVRLVPLIAAKTDRSNLNASLELMKKINTSIKLDPQTNVFKLYFDNLREASVAAEARTLLPDPESDVDATSDASSDGTSNATSDDTSNATSDGTSNATSGECVVVTYSQAPNTWLQQRQCSNSKADLNLLTVYCSQRNAEGVETILKKLDENAFEPHQRFSVINFYLSQGDLERTRHHFDKVYSIANLEIGDWLIVGFATLLTANGKFDEARKLLTEHRFVNNWTSVQMRASKTAAFVSTSLAHAGLDATLDLVRYVVPKFGVMSSGVLLPLIKCAIERDIHFAVELFVEFATLFRVTSGTLQLYRRLIADRNKADLLRVLQTAGKVHDPKMANLLLGFSYVLAHDVVEARKFFMTAPKSGSTTSRLQSWAEGLMKKNAIVELEILVDLVSECGFDSDELYLNLIKAYSKAENVDKVIQLWIKSQDDNVILSTRTLRAIAQICERNGRKAPFVTLT